MALCGTWETGWMILNLESSQFSFTLEPAESPASMGREEPCNIVVESTSVSRKHCELTCENGNWFVKDLGSRYGTTVNGTAATQPTALGNGDVLKLGSQNFIISLMASNDMEDLGRHLSGGKVKGLIGQAMQKRPAAPKVPPAKKKRAESAPEATTEEKGEPADVAAQAESPGDDETSDGETGAKSAPAGKASKKTSLRSRPAPRKSSPVLAAVKVVVLLGALGAAGFFGWKQYQQQAASAAPLPASGGNTPAIKLPPKPDAVALPAEEKKSDAMPEPAKEEKAESKPDAK